MAQLEYDLGAAELEVLKVLWDGGPLTVRQVHTHLHECGRKVAYTTVLTFLTRLEQKNYVVSDKSELAYVYRAAVSRDRVGRSRLKNLVQQLYDGAVAPAVLQLVRSETLTREELDEFQALIDRLDAKLESKKKRTKR